MANLYSPPGKSFGKDRVCESAMNSPASQTEVGYLPEVGRRIGLTAKLSVGIQ